MPEPLPCTFILSINLSICLSFYLSIFLSIYLSIYRSIYLSIYLGVSTLYTWAISPVHWLSIYLSFYLYRNIYLGVSTLYTWVISPVNWLSIYLSICLSRSFYTIYLSYLPRTLIIKSKEFIFSGNHCILEEVNFGFFFSKQSSRFFVLIKSDKNKM